MKKSISFLLLVLIGFVTVSSAKAQSVTLKLQPKQGQSYAVVSKASMTTKMTVQGQTMNMFQTMETKQSFTAKSVSSQQCVIESQVDAMKMSISQMGMKLEIDTENPQKTDPMLQEQAKAIEEKLKKPVDLTYDTFGNIVGDYDDVDTSQLSNVIIQLPKQELTVGSKWNMKNTQEVSGTKMVVNMEYTVTAISKKSVDLSFTGNVDSKDITGTYSGTASINPQTGIMTKSTTKSNLSMTVSEQDMNIPVTISGNSTVEVK